MGDADLKADLFIDLDTGRKGRWPADQPPLADSPQGIDAARQWAAEQGYDLMCVQTPGAAGDAPYQLVGIHLQLWEMDTFDARRIEKRLQTGSLPVGRALDTAELLHLDPTDGSLRSELGTSFVYVTADEGLGIITLDDFITEARDITGMFEAPRGVGFNRGVKFDLRTIGR